MSGCLYMLSFPNGRSYIGITVRPLKVRLRNHWDASKKQGRQTAICRAIRKYGKDGFTCKELVRADDWKYLCLLEQRAIVAYGTRAPNGYNLTDGGEGAPGQAFTENHRAAMARRRGKPSWNKGLVGVYAHTPSSKAKLSAAMKGRIFSEESKRKMSLRAMGNKKLLGTTMSPENRAKMSARFAGRVKTPAEIEKLVASHGLRDNPPCPHCGFQGTNPIVMGRWHFDKCKSRKAVA